MSRQGKPLPENPARERKQRRDFDPPILISYHTPLALRCGLRRLTAAGWATSFGTLKSKGRSRTWHEHARSKATR